VCRIFAAILPVYNIPLVACSVTWALYNRFSVLFDKKKPPFQKYEKFDKICNKKHKKMKIVIRGRWKRKREWGGNFVAPGNKLETNPYNCTAKS
jgi:hypothetical protein